MQRNAELFVRMYEGYLPGRVGGYVASLITNIVQHNNTATNAGYTASQ